MKILCFLKKRPGMTRAAFIEYYETRHVPLVNSLIPFYKEYRRNYASEVQDYQTGHLENKLEAATPFDVVTELSFENKQMYDKMVSALSDPKIGDVIAKDEENLFDRSKMSIYLVDEYRTA